MKIELRKFKAIDNFRFLMLTLNSDSAKGLNRSFFDFILKGVKDLFSKPNLNKFVILVDGKFAGSIGIFKVDKFNEIGFYISPEFRRKGIGTKALKEMLVYYKINLKAVTTPDNLATVKVLKNNEFKLLKANKRENELIFERRLN
ncbi:MAG: GNAT family N-acetyltransferase [Nanoarchaeota archaeon]